MQQGKSDREGILSVQESFKKMVAEIRDLAMSSFDRLMNTDITQVTDFFKGYELTHKLLSKLTETSSSS